MVFLAFLLSAYFLGDAYGVPISVFALGGAIIFLMIASFSKAVKPQHIIKEAPWQVVWFSIGLYIVVYGLKNHRVDRLFNGDFKRFSAQRGYSCHYWNQDL